MEAITQPLDWSDRPEAAANSFRAFRSPADVTAIVDSYGKWLSTSTIPKLFRPDPASSGAGDGVLVVIDGSGGARSPLPDM